MLLIQIKCVDLKWEVNRMQMSIMCIADVDKVFFFFHFSEFNQGLYLPP
jgi:hypothetical protein